MSNFETEVPGVFADDMIQRGTDQFPVFNVSPEVGLTNSEKGRRQIPFEPGSNVDNYVRNSEVNRDFYVRYDNGGDVFLKKIK